MTMYKIPTYQGKPDITKILADITAVCGVTDGEQLDRICGRPNITSLRSTDLRDVILAMLSYPHNDEC